MIPSLIVDQNGSRMEGFGRLESIEFNWMLFYRPKAVVMFSPILFDVLRSPPLYRSQLDERNCSCTQIPNIHTFVFAPKFFTFI